jgi:hypothetical protein
MSVSLLTARTEVRSLLDEPNPQFWSNAEINSWLNQGCQDIARQAQSLWMETVIPAVPLQQLYALPSDFLGIHRIEYVIGNSDQTYTLDYRGIKTMDEVWGILHQLPAAFPQAFWLWNDTGLAGGQPYFGCYPVVADNGQFNVWYYRDAIPATADTALIDVTPSYEDITYEYAVFKAKRKDRDPTWQEAKAIYDGQLMAMFNKTSRFTDQGDQFTSGVPNWPLYLYADTNSWY